MVRIYCIQHICLNLHTCMFAHVMVFAVAGITHYGCTRRRCGNRYIKEEQEPTICAIP
jgi:hypothetical protein